MKIAVYCGSVEGKRPCFKEAGVKVGEWIAKRGDELVYGGADSGIMGAVANAVLKGGQRVIGVLPDVESIQARKHQSLSEYINTPDMAERKKVMLDLSDVYIALPGGPGTLDELSEVISLARLKINNKPVVLFDTEGYYTHLREFFETMVQEGFAEACDFDGVLISDDFSEIEKFIWERR